LDKGVHVQGMCDTYMGMRDVCIYA